MTKENCKIVCIKYAKQENEIIQPRETDLEVDSD